MKIKKWTLLSFLLITLNVLAEDNSRVALKDGINMLDINGDGVKDLVVYSRFENNTSHPNDTLTLFMIDSQGKYHIVPVANDMGFTWSDFMLSASTTKIADYALYKKSDGYFMISAHKLTGGNYGEDVADALPVKFTRYDMNSHQDSPGVPLFSWEYKSAYISAEKYQDIDEAFQQFNLTMLK